jgi:hypothetical protein
MRKGYGARDETSNVQAHRNLAGRDEHLLSAATVPGAMTDKPLPRLIDLPDNRTPEMSPDTSHRANVKDAIEIWMTLRFLFWTAISSLVPFEFTSETLLIQELRARNVQSRLFPMSCIAEIADITLKRVRMMDARSRQLRLPRIPLRSNLEQRTEYVADRIAEILGIKAIERDDSSLTQEDRAELEVVLTRHGLR